ncbi:MAG: NADH:flavin oxidoreductase [Deltaproteobacteria bacterium]|nr:MAG: NADH:flavin oxidoreductase [Deltaproteobacteria bacterium]
MLDTALTLRSGVTLPNRIALAPLTNTMSQADGRVSEDDLRFLVARSRGGFGLVETCATFVSAEGKAWAGQLGISDEAHVPGLTELAAAIEVEGGRSIVQLHHAGVKADQAPEKLSTVDGDGVRGATAADLKRVVDDFVAAADRAVRAGFSGVEIHGANGYLFTQFLAPKDNPRTDAYGGSLANRARLLREVLQAVRSEVPDDFAVGVRLSPVDFYDLKGLVLSDSVQVGEWLAEDGADWVHLSGRDASGTPPKEPGAPVIARAFRDALPREVAVLAVGGIWTREDAERAMHSGADVAVLGKAAMAHADWPRASAAAEFAPVKPTWSLAHLKQAALGEAFLRYIQAFPGMVEGGKPPR